MAPGRHRVDRADVLRGTVQPSQARSELGRSPRGRRKRVSAAADAGGAPVHGVRPERDVGAPHRRGVLGRLGLADLRPRETTPRRRRRPGRRDPGGRVAGRRVLRAGLHARLPHDLLLAGRAGRLPSPRDDGRDAAPDRRQRRAGADDSGQAAWDPRARAGRGRPVARQGLAGASRPETVARRRRARGGGGCVVLARLPDLPARPA